ncbi:unnamed protein product, partial [marine sediment metagenome]
FAKNNKVATGVLVGAAVASGLALTRKEFQRNPAFALGKAIAFLFPEKILKLGGKLIKADKIIAATQAEKFSKNTFELKQDLTTGKFRVDGDISGVLVGNKPFESKYVLNFNPKKKEFNGFITTKTKSGKTRQTLKFKDEGGFFKDVKTGEKFAKSRLPITEKKIKLKETEISPTQQSTIIQSNDVFFKQGADVKVILTSILNSSKKIITKNSQVLKLIDPKTKKLIKAFSSQLTRSIKKKRTSRIKKLDPRESRAIESFLKS